MIFLHHFFPFLTFKYILTYGRIVLKRFFASQQKSRLTGIENLCYFQLLRNQGDLDVKQADPSLEKNETARR